ncbi:efflux RND transporter permease subunit [Psychrosphaera ytuae]|uniref:Efflux RND transporter permease subunit n=1 Tax=Psychrosphaera ytuae TaxID=2820710 RepID=A0A975DA03_9GAMM|nr:efflux RND transporter permease subunit [Psychrosphaera ytuae]QTH63093.1 efflux RND transporter permease subunit [Psychrosphaera ytuae]
MLLHINRYLGNNVRLLGLIIAMVMMLGTSSLVTMPKAEDPQFYLPISVVEVIAPGMSPALLETQVVGPIEQSLELVEDIKTIETKIRHGAVNITVRFIHGTEADAGFDEVVRAVSRVQNRFPEDVQKVLYFKASPITVNVLQLAISHPDNDWQTIKRTATKLKDELQALDNVQRAQIWGMPEMVVAVAVDSQKLIQHNISIEQVQQAIGSRGKATHAGYIDDQQVRFTINLSGEYKSIKEIEQTVVKTNGTAQVLVSDVANISLEFYKPDNLAFVGNQPVVYVTVQQRDGTNIYTLGKQTRAVVDQFSQTHPEVHVSTIVAQEDSVRFRINGFLGDLASGLILILVCLFFFMGFKQSMWVSLALPLTIFATLTLMNMMGFVLQQMTIAGLIVALGLLVDNSLVVVEQFVKVKDQVASRAEAVQRVIQEVGMPLVAGTLTTVFAFLPLLLLQSDTGDFMRALPVSVSIALVMSLVVALVVLPVLMGVFGVSQESSWSLSHYLNKFADGPFSRFLHVLLTKPVLVILVFIAIVVGCASLMSQVGVSLFPKAEKNTLVVNLETPVQSSIEHTKSVTLQLSNELQQFDGVQQVVSTVGATSPQIYYNHVPERGRTNYAQLLVITEEYEKNQIQNLIKQIRNKYSSSTLGRINVFEFQQGPVTDRPVTFRILGDDLEQVARRASELQAFMEKQEHVFDVRNISAESGLAYDIRIDEIKAHQKGVELASAERQVRLLIDGAVAATINDRFGQGFRVLVKGEATGALDLDQIYIKNQLGKPIPLSSFADVQVTRLQPAFYHYQRTRMNRVSADVMATGNVAKVTAEIDNYLQSLSWNNGLSYKIGGEEEARKQSFGGLSQIMIIVVVGIFVLLFVQFNSFAQPMVIISLLPIAFAGAVVGMFVTGLSFSMMAFIGLISLIGIMVNDAIIVVDGFNKGRVHLLDKRDAMVKSASSRFTPVILTSLTTIVGLLPLTLFGGDLWMPMGTVIITGLLFTTLASLIWVPAFTMLVTRSKTKAP